METDGLIPGGDSVQHVAALLGRLQIGRPSARLDVDERGRATISWEQDDVDHLLVLLVDEKDLAAALRDIGTGSRDALWPDVTVEEAGLRLLLVHLDEVVDTRDTSEPLRITEQGLLWPELPRPTEPDEWP